MTQLSFEVTRRRRRSTSPERIAEILENPGFGKTFTDHMVVATWTADGAGATRRSSPTARFQLDPAAAVLHYAQEIFEGMKAYRHADGSIWTFRPEANAARFARSARRLALPELPEADFIESLRQLVSVDQDWVPAGRRGGEEPLPAPVHVRVRGLPRRASGPAGHLLRHRLAGRRLLLRAASSPSRCGSRPTTRVPGEGGTGAAKCGGNYASSLAGQLEGIEHGCDQAVFLDSSTHTYIEELGGMNLFLVTKDGRIITPELTGSILEGVTRSSILEIAKEHGPRARGAPHPDRGVEGGRRERRASSRSSRAAPPPSSPRSASCAGPAARSTTAATATRTATPRRSAPRLLDIQYGRAEDTRGWLTRLV